MWLCVFTRLHHFMQEVVVAGTVAGPIDQKWGWSWLWEAVCLGHGGKLSLKSL